MFGSRGQYFSEGDIINILPLVEGVMVFVSGDILFPECDIFSLVWSSTITPPTKGSMFFFIILNASSKEDFEFLLESANHVHITT
jgi:hypothetical protein